MSAQGDVIRLQRQVRDLEARLARMQRANETLGGRFAFAPVAEPFAPAAVAPAAAAVAPVPDDPAPAVEPADAAWQRLLEQEKPGPAGRWVPPRFRRGAR